jgi:hypothetical protein
MVKLVLDRAEAGVGEDSWVVLARLAGGRRSSSSLEERGEGVVAMVGEENRRSRSFFVAGILTGVTAGMLAKEEGCLVAV